MTKIAIIGLGYVGLPLALGFGKAFPGTCGFDSSTEKIKQLKAGIDPTDEGQEAEISSAKVLFTNDPSQLAGCNFFIICVPTPVDENKQPDLGAIIAATKTICSVIQKGAVVVLESTVYPGVTEDICGKLIEELTQLKSGIDFTLGYSPERINPGDKEHSLERVIKVIGAQDEKTLRSMEEVYGKVVKAGLHKAPSIKVAEAAKVIENTQRDLNIALMNELAIIFDRMGIRTSDVLAAAGSKWNFLKFTPGLVGGHCIGVDPYYLTMKAQHLGYHPQVILAGRQINDDMGRFIAQRSVKLLINSGIQPKGARVGILGITFKENITDIRNSRVPDIIHELKEFGIDAIVHDPYAAKDAVQHEYGVKITGIEDFQELDALILAVPHKVFLELGAEKLCRLVKNRGVFVDIKSAFAPRDMTNGVTYWSL